MHELLRVYIHVIYSRSNRQARYPFVGDLLLLNGVPRIYLLPTKGLMKGACLVHTTYIYHINFLP